MDTGESWFRLRRERGSARVWRMVAPRRPRSFTPLSYPVARAATVSLTALGFFAIHFIGARILGAALTRDVLPLEQARWLWVVGLASASFFAGHTAAVGMLDAYARARVVLPRDLPPSTARRARNPWRVALQSLAVWGGLSAAISCVLLPHAWAHGVSVHEFSWSFAAASACLGAAAALQYTGRSFLDQARLSPEQRRFPGSLQTYLWRRHVLPQALVNTVLNGFVGAAIAPVALMQSTVAVPASFIRHDALSTALGLTLIIAGGVHSYAMFERRWGVAPTPREPGSERLGSARSVLGMVVFAAVAWLGLSQLPALAPWTFIVLRALGCGLLSALVAYAVARRTVYGATTADDS